MKKVKLKEDVKLMGWKILRKGSKFDVSRFNSRFVYIEVDGKTIRLSAGSVEKIY